PPGSSSSSRSIQPGRRTRPTPRPSFRPGSPRPQSSGSRNSRSGWTWATPVTASRPSPLLFVGRVSRPSASFRSQPHDGASGRPGPMACTSSRPLPPVPEDIDFLAEIGRLVALAVEATLARQELAQANERLAALTARLAEEKQYLEEEIRTEGRFGEIIGESPILRDVLAQVEAVAGTDSAVLISGGTGPGEGPLAPAAPPASPRHGRPLAEPPCA